MIKRRSKAELDPSILTRILDVISVGAGKKAAAAQVSISEETLRCYEKWGADAVAVREAALERGEEPVLNERERLFADFHDGMEAAQSHTRVYMLGLIQKAAKLDWRAGAFLLEKICPEDFGPRAEIKHSGEVTSKIIDYSKLTESELFQLRALRAKLLRDHED